MITTTSTKQLSPQKNGAIDLALKEWEMNGTWGPLGVQLGLQISPEISLVNWDIRQKMI